MKRPPSCFGGMLSQEPINGYNTGSAPELAGEPEITPKSRQMKVANGFIDKP